ncbi:MAG: L-aspartate oxidase [Aeromicrobium erythreum]
MARVVVVGSGVAGLTAALDAAPRHDVVLCTKAALGDSSTRYAQGGVAVVLDAMTDPAAPRIGDSVAAHVRDTLAAGAGLSDPAMAQVLCGEGPAAIDRMLERSVPFDRHDGVLAHGLEAAHSFARILHAGGDATGAAISSTLVERLRATDVDVREQTTVLDVLVEDGVAVGVRLLGGEELRADAVVLATGGAGQLFPYTTNPAVATADGVAIGLRAGAVAADLELQQFHPTALDAPGTFLVSEAVRGEGAVLLDADGRRFMPDVHPDAELAPRDVVARAIAEQMARQEGLPVRLDATALGAAFLAERFPTIDAAVRARGFDWAQDPIPVTPAAHYLMGGLRTDPWGRTSVRGLHAVGEVACTGVQGANRLASNSLLEGAVMGARVVAAIEAGWTDPTFDASWSPTEALDLVDRPGASETTRSDLQRLLWDAAGLARDGAGLTAAQDVLAGWRTPRVTDAKSAEDANLLLVGRAVVASALRRRESRGAHARRDLPGLAPGPARHTCVQARRTTEGG